MGLRSEFRRWPALGGWVWEEQLFFQDCVPEPYSTGQVLLSGEAPTGQWGEPWVLGVVNKLRCPENRCLFEPPGVRCAAHVHWSWEVRGVPGMNAAPADVPHGMCSERFEAESRLLLALTRDYGVVPLSSSIVAQEGAVVQPATSAVAQEGANGHSPLRIVYPDTISATQERLPGL